MTQVAASKTAATADSLGCMELVGGNRVVRQALTAPGLDVWLDSRPFKAEAGGDVHYFSRCGSGRVTRLAIADVSGHGKAADQMALWLRGLMRKYINLLDQTGFAQAINREFAAGTEDATFATAMLMTYYAPTNHLIVCNAGHPRPLWYDSRKRQWKWLDAQVPEPGPSLREARGTYLLRPVHNLPLGVIEPTDFVQFAVNLSMHDLVVVYTDGISEARNPARKMLGEDGLLQLVQETALSEPARFGADLLDKIDAWREGRPADDDQTLIVLRRNEEALPRPTLRSAMGLLGKMLGLRRV